RRKLAPRAACSSARPCSLKAPESIARVQAAIAGAPDEPMHTTTSLVGAVAAAAANGMLPIRSAVDANAARARAQLRPIEISPKNVYPFLASMLALTRVVVLPRADLVGFPSCVVVVLRGRIERRTCGRDGVIELLQIAREAIGVALDQYLHFRRIIGELLVG